MHNFYNKHMLRFCGRALIAGELWVATMLSQAADVDQLHALASNGQHQQVVTLAELELQAKPRDAQIRFIKGVSQAALGQYDDAEATFWQLTQDFPELAEPYNNLAAAYARQGLWNKARAALEMALRVAPNYKVARENLQGLRQAGMPRKPKGQRPCRHRSQHKHAGRLGVALLSRYRPRARLAQ